MNNNFIKKALFFTLLFSLLIPLISQAITIVNPISATSFEELINAVLNFVFWVAIAIVPIMIIVAAYFFLTSGGDPAKVGQAKKVILYTLIGLFIVLSGRGIASIIKEVISGGGGGEGGGCVPTVPPCDGNCPAGCIVTQDPDCGCTSSNCCCPSLVCAQAGDSDCIGPTKISNLGDKNGDQKIDMLDTLGGLPDIDGNGTPNDACDQSMFSHRTFGKNAWDLLSPTLLSNLGDKNGDQKIDMLDTLGGLPDIDGNGTPNDACDQSMFSHRTFGWDITGSGCP